MWEVTNAESHGKLLKELLNEGWEPFNVMEGRKNFIHLVWLRRKKENIQNIDDKRVTSNQLPQWYGKEPYE